MGNVAIVRLLIGDSEEILTDAEVQYFLDAHNSDPNEAAPFAANALYARIVQYVDSTTGSISTSWSQRAAGYLIFLKGKGWDTVGGVQLQGVFVGGTSQSELDTAKDNTNLPPRRFTVGVHEES